MTEDESRRKVKVLIIIYNALFSVFVVNKSMNSTEVESFY